MAAVFWKEPCFPAGFPEPGSPWGRGGPPWASLSLSRGGAVALPQHARTLSFQDLGSAMEQALSCTTVWMQLSYQR